MEVEAGFYPAGEVSGNHSSPAGIEFADCMDAGLPVRPTLPIQPIHIDSSESHDTRGGPPAPSSSSRLAAALGRSSEPEPLTKR